ncbi:MAG: anti-sigma factor MucA [Marinobacter sp. T13-3]|nr:MAG: anti-sigma factor MucA [Marinobacter sp. T13-3]
MDERLRETLSAMMDDEADELSVRRLLSHQEQTDVRDQWQRWQQIRDLMHDHHGPGDGVDVAAAVRENLDGRDQTAPATPAAPPLKAWGWPWSVAAMVMLAMVVGFGAGTGWESSEGADGQLVAHQPDVPASALPVSMEELSLQGLDEEQLKQMRQFMLEHAQHSSVGAGRGSVGYARVVSANSGY